MKLGGTEEPSTVAKILFSNPSFLGLGNIHKRTLLDRLLGKGKEAFLINELPFEGSLSAAAASEATTGTSTQKAATTASVASVATTAAAASGGQQNNTSPPGRLEF